MFVICLQQENTLSHLCHFGWWYIKLLGSEDKNDGISFPKVTQFSYLHLFRSIWVETFSKLCIKRYFLLSFLSRFCFQLATGFSLKICQLQHRRPKRNRADLFYQNWSTEMQIRKPRNQQVRNYVILVLPSKKIGAPSSIVPTMGGTHKPTLLLCISLVNCLQSSGIDSIC